MIQWAKLELKVHKLKQRLNTLENENEILKDTLKNELYIAIINKVGESDKIKKLQEENQRLRKHNKDLKELLGVK